MHDDFNCTGLRGCHGDSENKHCENRQFEENCPIRRRNLKNQIWNEKQITEIYLDINCCISLTYRFRS